MGRKLEEGPAPLGEGGAYLTECGRGRGLPAS